MRKLLYGLLLSIPGWLFAADFSQQLDGSEDPQKVSTMNGVQCIQYKQLSVLTRDEEDAVGQQILIKSGSDLACTWDTTRAWLVDSGEASYFIGKWQNYLFIDRGTGPDGRDILIFNVLNHQIGYSDTYAAPLAISSKRLSYWQGSYTLANAENCSAFAKAQETGLIPQIQTLVKVDLLNANLQAIKGSKTRCKLTQ